MAVQGDGAGHARLIMVRHGVTAWNRVQRFQGQIDTPLSDDGHEQARRAAQRLAVEPIAAVYSSDLARARDTAAPIARALGLPLQTEPGLRERGYGAFEGMTYGDIERDLAEAFTRWRAREPDFELPGGGETLRSFHHRVQAALDRLAMRHRGQAIVAVTHGGVLDSVYRIAAGLPIQAPRKHELLNASLNTIGWDGQAYSLIDWGDVRHLAGSLDDTQVAGP